MASLVIKNLPEDIHARLKAAAVKNHRSMTGQAVAILEEGLGAKRSADMPKPIAFPFKITQEFLDRAKREGRA
jgi:plasmid stability protein